MMRTSPKQFEMLVTYMEKHGDLGKQVVNSQSRLATTQHWKNLTSLLNRHGGGYTKTVEKWRKVWTDFKNNSKRKAKRLHKAAVGTDGHGQAVNYKLNDIEQRVLNLTGARVARGLAVEEIGLPLVGDNHSDSLDCIVVPSEGTGVEAGNQSGPSHQTHVGSLPPRLPVHRSPQFHAEDKYMIEDEDCKLSQVSSRSVTPELQPARAGQTSTSTRKRRTRPRSAKRSLQRPTRISNFNELAAELNDTEWREFRIQQRREYIEIRREENRVREIEMQTQREWQNRMLELLDKLVTKYCSERS